MLRSMTGFGKEMIVKDGKSVIIEIRTLNSKQLDINTRISPLFREQENEIRSILTQELKRGKVDFSLYVEKNEDPHISIDGELVKKYYRQFEELAHETGASIGPEIFIHSLKMPDVIISAKEELSEDFWKFLFKGIKSACDQVNLFRESEGKHLAEDIIGRTKLINNLIDEIIPHEENRIKNIREKFHSSLSEIPPEGKYDKNRFEEELIYYIEKIDITEEKVRLRKHCAYFLETILDEESNGKKLGFIVQEFGREINTIGSKANDFNIQQIVVQMKDEVEKIKEQLANIL